VRPELLRYCPDAGGGSGDKQADYAAKLSAIRNVSIYIQILALTLLHIYTLPSGPPVLCSRSRGGGGGYPTPSHTRSHTLSYRIVMGFYSLSRSLSLSHTYMYVYHGSEDASSMATAGATANTTEGSSRASRESVLLCSHSHGESIGV